MERSDVRFILVRLAVVLGIVLVFGLLVAMGMRMVNRAFGVEESGEQSDGTGAGADSASPSVQDSLWVPAGATVLPDPEELPEGPEQAWEQTPCTLFTAEGGETVVDSLPLAPSPEHKSLEALFLIRRWGEAGGLDEEEVGRIFVFNRMDTLYVDLPEQMDLEALRSTVESRFICFTRLYPLVGGNLLSGYPDGIPLRGVPGVFR